MKKGYVVLLISLTLMLVAMISLVNAIPPACPVDNKESPTGVCVCGHSPNSTLGYGQIVIGGANASIISCNNILDGVCPEDFTDPITGKSANCSTCPDPDCTVNNSLDVGYVSGKVTDKSGKGILGATVTGRPIKWNNSANLDRSVTTDDYGDYSSKDFLSGRYMFTASKQGYDTQLREVTVIRGTVTTSINFQLSNGTCYDDCTNSENICSAVCDGVTFNDTNTKCSFFSNATFPAPTIRNACDNQPQGSIVKLNQYNENYTYFVRCCGEEDNKPYLERYVKARPDNSRNTVANLVKTEKIAKRYGYPVRVVVAYWPKRTTATS